MHFVVDNFYMEFKLSVKKLVMTKIVHKILLFVSVHIILLQ